MRQELACLPRDRRFALSPTPHSSGHVGGEGKVTIATLAYIGEHKTRGWRVAIGLFRKDGYIGTENSRGQPGWSGGETQGPVPEVERGRLRTSQLPGGP